MVNLGDRPPPPSSPPRVTHVTSGKEALSAINKKSYDLVITMSKHIGMDPFEFGKKIKKVCANLPVILLATDTADLHFCQKNIQKEGVDKAFFWYGDTSLFMAIVKCEFCKHEQDTDVSRICDRCGRRMGRIRLDFPSENSSSEEETEQGRCPVCGAATDRTICPNCGSRVKSGSV